MIRIAIVDDDDYICSRIEEMIEQYAKNSMYEFSMDIFNSGEMLYDYCRQGHIYDIIFLDIELYQLNGIEVGLLIRKEMKNNITQIVFISGKSGYAEQLFQVRPLDFLRKPITYENVAEQLSSYISLYGQERLYFDFVSDKIEHRAMLENIIYFESKGKKIIIKTAYDTWEFYGKLKELQNRSFSNGFISIHQSYYVNLLHIIDYQYKSIRLSNGEELKISRNKAKEVRQRLLKLNTD